MGRITEMPVAKAIVTMVTVNVGGEANIPVTLVHRRRTHDRGRRLIASVGWVYYRPRSGQCDWTPWEKSDIYDCLVVIVTHANGSCTSRVFSLICLFVCFSAQDVCLSVCLFTWCLKNRCSYDHKTWHTYVRPWILETHLFCSEMVKGQGHESQEQCQRQCLHSCECWLLLVLYLHYLRLPFMHFSCH